MADKKISELPASSALDLDDFLAVVEDGTTVQATIEDILALSTTSGLPEGYSIPAFVQASGSDQTTTMTAAIDALPADGGVVLIPAGEFYSEILIDSHAGLTFRGAGAEATTIIGPVASTLVTVSGSPRGNVTFEDMTFDLSTATMAAVVYAFDFDYTFRRCRFTNINNYGIYCIGSRNTVIEDCEFDDAGTATGQAVACGDTVLGLRWIRSKARFMETGISFDNTPHDDIDIDGGLFDGGWYLLRTRSGGYTNSGGTVTYTATGMADSAASFGALPGPYICDIRALPVLESGSTGTSYSFNKVEDATALFETNDVRPGHIVRTAGKWAVVAAVVSETRLQVEEWFDSTTYRVTEWPTAAEAYTVHRVLINYVMSNTGTTITTARWTDFTDGTSVTPAAGTLYEVLINHGGYSGIHASAATPRAAGSMKRIRVHGGCHFTRSWNDQLSIYGSDSRLVADETVLIDHGQDYGITCHSDHARIFATTIHNGAIGIYTTGDDCRIDAFASGSPYMNPNDSYLGDILISGNRTRVSGSIVVAAGVWARYGIVVAGPPYTGSYVDSTDLSGTTATGYSTAGYRLYSLTTPTVTVTGTILRDTVGPYSIDGATGSIFPEVAHGLATDTARWGVPGCTRLSSSGAQVMTLDKIYYEPFIVHSPITVTALGIDITTPAAAGKKARLNIYSASQAWQPITRLLADGTVNIDSGVLVQRSGLGLVLSPGLYLAAYTGEATANIRVVPMGGADMGSNTDAWSTHIDRVEVAATYAALPATGTAWTTTSLITGIGVNHGLWMKWTG